MKISLSLLVFVLAVNAQSPGTFTATGNMTTPRVGHSATLLGTGQVLIAGGSDGKATVAFAELFDPTTGTFAATGNMTIARPNHTATLLPDGKVLIAGSQGDGKGNRVNAELYDPSSGTFSLLGAMTTADGVAALLADGRVLIAGESTAEVYDSATGALAATGAYPESPGRFVSAATLLADGRALITGGPTELYDPATNQFSVTVPMRYYHGATFSATLLASGKVLIVGGGDEGISHVGSEFYDASTGTFTSVGMTTTDRARHTGTLLPDGTVLIAGSLTEGPDTAELYDPVSSTFSSTGKMTANRFSHTATLLPDGRVLIVGGFSNPGVTSSAELYTPAALVRAAALLSLSGDGKGQGAILHAGTPRVVSADNRAVEGEALEIYCTGLADGSAIPPQVAIGGLAAEVLFFGKAPGFAGLNQVNVRVPSGVAPGDSVPVRLTYLGRPSNAVTIGVQ
jgi:hypothetical protein